MIPSNIRKTNFNGSQLLQGMSRFSISRFSLKCMATSIKKLRGEQRWQTLAIFFYVCIHLFSYHKNLYPFLTGWG